jgi:hypothetical protein
MNRIPKLVYILNCKKTNRKIGGGGGILQGFRPTYVKVSNNKSTNCSKSSYASMIPSLDMFVSGPLVEDGDGIEKKTVLNSSVADPDPDSPDPHVFGSPGSGSESISQRYGSGTGSGSGSPSKKSEKNLDSFCFVTSF